MPYDNVYWIKKTADVWYYTRKQPTKDLLVVILIGFIYNFIAFLCMIMLNREKQNEKPLRHMFRKSMRW